jgi:anti-anti-sigma factor
MTAALRLVTPYTPTVGNVVKLARDPGLPHRWKFKAEVHAVLDSGIAHVVIDCTEAGYLDGRDRGVLISLSKHAKEIGGSLVLRGLNADAREFFALTRIDTVLRIEEQT